LAVPCHPFGIPNLRFLSPREIRSSSLFVGSEARTDARITSLRFWRIRFRQKHAGGVGAAASSSDGQSAERRNIVEVKSSPGSYRGLRQLRVADPALSFFKNPRWHSIPQSRAASASRFRRSGCQQSSSKKELAERTREISSGSIPKTQTALARSYPHQAHGGICNAP